MPITASDRATTLEPACPTEFNRDAATDRRLASLVYVHDPMCSWCWAFAPAFEGLCSQLDDRVVVTRLLGGLAADTDQPMAADMQAFLQGTWRRIAGEVPGTTFNHDFWHQCRPRRSTWPACRAVIAARALDAGAEVRMIRAIQQAYYLQARNPSDTGVLVELAGECGLQPGDFAALLDAGATHATLADEIGRSRRMGVSSFPSLRLLVGGHPYRVDIDYNDPESMRDRINALLAT
jgi:putative protein-disulfide isomerase